MVSGGVGREGAVGSKRGDKGRRAAVSTCFRELSVSAGSLCIWGYSFSVKRERERERERDGDEWAAKTANARICDRTGHCLADCVFFCVAECEVSGPLKGRGAGGARKIV